MGLRDDYTNRENKIQFEGIEASERRLYKRGEVQRCNFEEIQERASILQCQASIVCQASYAEAVDLFLVTPHGAFYSTRLPNVYGVRRVEMVGVGWGVSGTIMHCQREAVVLARAIAMEGGVPLCVSGFEVCEVASRESSGVVTLERPRVVST